MMEKGYGCLRPIFYKAKFGTKMTVIKLYVGDAKSLPRAGRVRGEGEEAWNT